MSWINTKFFQTATAFSLIACCTVLPLSTALLSLCTISTLIFWLLSGKFKDIPELFRTNSVVLLSCLLFALFILGMTYTNAAMDDALSYLKKYRELLLIPIVLSILRDNPALKRRCENGFLLGCTLLLISSYGMYFSILPTLKIGNSTLYHITHSFFISILAFYTAQKSLNAITQKSRYLWALLYFSSAVNLFYIAPGRTGMLVFVFLMCLILVQRLTIFKQIIYLVLLICMIFLTYKTSANLQTRTKQASEEIQAYEYGASRTSLGMRFDWWINSIQIIKEKPLFGHGTGSFDKVHTRFIQGSDMVDTDNPHNEYLLIGVQLGLVGVTLFLMLFLAQYFCSFKLKKPDKLFLQGVVTAMIVGCIMNSFLYDSHQGHFWAILSAVHLSPLPKCSPFTTR